MKNKGITLIALVITIIVLLILAGITISLTIGDQGIITRAQQASKNYKDAEVKEQDELNNFDTELDDIIEGKTTKKIDTLEEFTEFRDEVNNGETFEGITIKLTTDIDLSSVCNKESGVNWEPIGTEEKPFKGTFDGNGHAINNLYISTDQGNVGLFRYILDSKIKNLRVSGNIVAKEIASGIAVYAYNSEIYNCITNVNIEQKEGQRAKISGIASELFNGTKIVNCINFGNLISDTGYVGGISSNINKGSSIINCANYGNITVNKESGWTPAGGIVGALTDGKVENCANFGNLIGSEDVCGVIGTTVNSVTGNEIKNCYNSGKVNAKIGAGIVAINNGAGNINAKTTIQNCYNIGLISITGSKSDAIFITENNSIEPEYLQIYYLTGSCTTGKGEEKNEDQLVDDILLNYDSEIWTNDVSDDENEFINKGYPILTWQKQYIKIVSEILSDTIFILLNEKIY